MVKTYENYVLLIDCLLVVVKLIITTFYSNE